MDLKVIYSSHVSALPKFVKMLPEMLPFEADIEISEWKYVPQGHSNCCSSPAEPNGRDRDRDEQNIVS